MYNPFAIARFNNFADSISFVSSKRTFTCNSTFTGECNHKGKCRAKTKTFGRITYSFLDFSELGKQIALYKLNSNYLILKFLKSYIRQHTQGKYPANDFSDIKISRLHIQKTVLISLSDWLVLQKTKHFPFLFRYQKSIPSKKKKIGTTLYINKSKSLKSVLAIYDRLTGCPLNGCQRTSQEECRRIVLNLKIIY